MEILIHLQFAFTQISRTNLTPPRGGCNKCKRENVHWFLKNVEITHSWFHTHGNSVSYHGCETLDYYKVPHVENTFSKEIFVSENPQIIHMYHGLCWIRKIPNIHEQILGKCFKFLKTKWQKSVINNYFHNVKTHKVSIQNV